MPVSHDPSLIKNLLLKEDELPGTRGLSHIVFRPGTVVGTHSHPEGREIFYCIRGRLSVTVAEREVQLSGGHCLMVEPGEPHSFHHVTEETELVYFFLLSA